MPVVMIRQLDALTTIKEQTTDPVAPTAIVDASRYPPAGLANRLESGALGDLAAVTHVGEGPVARQ